MSRYMPYMLEVEDIRNPGTSTLCEAAAFLSHAMIELCKQGGDTMPSWLILNAARQKVVEQLYLEALR